MTPKLPAPGDPLRLDGFLYTLGPIVRLVVGLNRVPELAQVIAENPPLQEPGTGRITIDNSDPDRWTAVRAFARPPHPDPEIQARRVANFNYKKAGECLEADLVWAEPADYLEEAKAQGAALVRGSASVPLLQKWRQAWVDAATAEIADRVTAGKFAGAWMLAGRALIKPRPPLARDDTHAGASIAELDRFDIPAAVAGILTSTLDLGGRTNGKSGL